MARGVQYWLDIMLTEKAGMATLNKFQPAIDSSQTLLTDLKSTSKVARWRLIFWVVACCAHALDVVMDLAIAIMEALAAKSRYGTIAWYNQVARDFQYGDALVQVDLEWKYAVIDETKKIIKLANAQDGPGVVNLKIATIVGGVTQPVVVAEYNAFKAYIDKKKPAGITVNVINDAADDLRTALYINYDPLVMSATGELIATPGTFPVQDAYDEYLKSLEFDGAFELMKLIDKIQAAAGVVSAYVISAEARYGVNPYVAFTQRYYPNAGHLVIDGASTITYNPNV